MRLGKCFFGVFVFFVGILVILGNGKTAEARKYYSLQEVGLSGCTADNVDYTIVSIRGNAIKYIKYQFFSKTCRWKKVSGIQTAKLTSGTKYYIGNSDKVSDSLKKNAENGKSSKMNSKKVNTKKMHLSQKTKNINTEKWIYRVSKGTLKKNLHGRNNEIRVVNGKVTKLAVKLSY